jgi:Tol biopolymer transport system component
MDDKQIRDHLSTLVNSAHFASSPRLAEFLCFCVEAALSGESESLKESIIGASVFHRPPGYDTKLDPIVRVNAIRLRKRLNQYYERSLRPYPVRIDIPKGTYVPNFEILSQPPCESTATATQDLLDEVSRSGEAQSTPEEIPDSEQVPDVSSIVQNALDLQPSGERPAIELPAASISNEFNHGRGPRSRWLLWLLIVFLLIIGLTLSMIQNGRARARSDHAHADAQATAPPPSGPHSLLLRQLTNLPGIKNDPEISPDRRTLAFLWDPLNSGTARVYLQQEGEGSPLRLTKGTQPEVRFAWSGDGKSIALLRMVKPTTYQLAIIEVATKKQRVLRTFAFSYTLDRPALDWSRDGKWLVESEQDDMKAVHLELVSADTGLGQQITDPPDGSTGDLEARFSPKSDVVAFRRGQLGELYVTSIHNQGVNSATRLTFSNPGVRGISWSPDESSIYFGSTAGGNVPAIWCYDRLNRTLQMVSTGGIAAISPSLDLGGEEISFLEPQTKLSLWRYHFSPHPTSGPFGHAQGLEITPSISPDGTSVAFVYNATGTMELWSARTDGSDMRRLTYLNGDGFPLFPSWSSDGKVITFFLRKTGFNYALEIPSSGGKAKQLRGGADYSIYPQYSHDRHWLYFISNMGNRFRVWRISLIENHTNPQEVTLKDTRFFRVATDSEGLYYLSPTGSTIALIYHDLKTNTEHPVWQWRQAPVGFTAWDISQGQLYYVAVDPVSLAPHLFTANLATSGISDLGVAPVSYWLGVTSVAASPDGQTVWVSKVEGDGGNLMSLRLESQHAQLAQINLPRH